MFTELKVSKKRMFLLPTLEISTRAATVNKAEPRVRVPTQTGLKKKAVDAKRPPRGEAAVRGSAERVGSRWSGSRETPLTDVRERRVPRADPPRALVTLVQPLSRLGYFRQPPARAAARVHFAGNPSSPPPRAWIHV